MKYKVCNTDFNKFAKDSRALCKNCVLGSIEEGEIIEDNTKIDPNIFNVDERKVFDFTMDAVNESCEGQCAFVPNRL